jgi:hypothetical protein
VEGEKIGGERLLVAKLYSSLSTLRVPLEVRGVPDYLAAANALSPQVVLSTDTGGHYNTSNLLMPVNQIVLLI